MCGIAGVVYRDGHRPPDVRVMRRIAAQLSHRGPDGEGIWAQPGIALIHRRLSIIDLETGGQPMGNEDGALQVVFNGEIYNYRELREWLQSKGHRFRSSSDTEVLVHLYEEVGEDLVSRLRGMFAFALWDARRRALLLGRDRVGIKPLYLFRDGEKLLFASEPKAILAHPDVPVEVDTTALDDFVAFGTTTGTRSIFRHIEKVAPAHILRVTADHLAAASRRYWAIGFEPDDDLTVADWCEQVRHKVSESVRGHLVADVPVGAFLSGGLDSSVVTATAASLQAGLRTFSVGFDDRSFDELPYARLVAEGCGTLHTEQLVTADAAAVLDDLSYYYDEPFADSSAVPTFLVSAVARAHVKVVLSGDGGDEAFGGYARYVHDLREARIRSLLPAAVRARVVAPLSRVWPKADWLPRPLRARTLLTNVARPAASAYANTLAVCREPLRRQLLSGDVRHSLDGYDAEAHVRAAYAGAFNGDPLTGMIGTDLATVLPDDYLVKVDRASMAHGLEVRPPLLDHELLELMARVPSKYKVAAGDAKWLLKQCYADVLPPEITRRPKRGFEMPLERWMAGPLQGLFRSTVLDPAAAVRPLIDQRRAEALLRDHVRGTARHGQILWSLLVLAKWAERYLGAAVPPMDTPEAAPLETAGV